MRSRRKAFAAAGAFSVFTAITGISMRHSGAIEHVSEGSTASEGASSNGEVEQAPNQLFFENVSTKTKHLISAAEYKSSTVISAGDWASTELPFERELINGKNPMEEFIEDEMITSALSSTRSIEEYVKEINFEQDPDIHAQNRIYSQVVDRAIMESLTPIRQNHLACGKRICVGVLSGGTEKDYIDWASAFASQPEAIGLGLTTVIVLRDENNHELRFAFAVQPFLYAK